MAGEAKTAEFMLGTATVMFGPAEDVFDLRPATHSVGLTKSVNITTEPQFTELSQGRKNSLVYSVMTGNAVRASFECYEYTAANLAYSLGLDGGNAQQIPTKTNLTAAFTSGDTTLEVSDATNFAEDDYVVVQGSEKDDLFVRTVVSITDNSITIDKAIDEDLPMDTEVRSTSVTEVGSKDTQPYLGCKIVGVNAEDTPITMIFPKIRVTSGLNLGFTTDDFSNIPFELTMYDLVPSDPQYAAMNGSQGLLMV